MMSFGEIQQSWHHALKNSFMPLWLTNLVHRRPVWQWAIAGVVGAALGVYTLAIPSLPSQWAPLFVLALLFPFIAMIVGNVRRLLLALIILDIPLGLDINFAYRYDLAELNAIGGFSVSLTTICLVVLYALWLAALLSKKQRQVPVLSWTGPTLFLTAFVAISTLSLVVARDVMLSLYELALLGQTFLLYIYIVGTVRTREEILFIVKTALVFLLVESLVMIGLRLVGHSISVGGISARISGTRVGGTIGSPNAAADYLALSLALALGVLLSRFDPFSKWLAALSFSLGSIALVFTLSRGGWVAFALSLTILYLVAWRRSRLSLGITLVIVAVLSFVALLFHETISARLFGGEGSSPETRFLLMRLALDIIKDNPLFGVGANNFALMIPHYATPEFSGWLHVVHNKYLLVLAEVGLGGLVTFLLFLFATVRRGWQCWKVEDPLLSPLALGLTAGVVGQMSHMFLSLSHSRPQVQMLWFVTALVMVMGNLADVGLPVPHSKVSPAVAFPTLNTGIQVGGNQG